jgi:hypothetical protein
MTNQQLLQVQHQQQQAARLCHQQQQQQLSAKKTVRLLLQPRVRGHHPLPRTSGQCTRIYGLATLFDVACRWVCPSIRVRIIDKKLASGKHYEEKVTFTFHLSSDL